MRPRKNKNMDGLEENQEKTKARSILKKNLLANSDIRTKSTPFLKP